MKSRSSEAETPPDPEIPAGTPDEFPTIHPSTGTPDDDDEPEDEHDGENEASQRECQEATEAPEEFNRNDEHQGEIQ